MDIQINTRQMQLAPLTHAQVDQNFTALKAGVEAVQSAVDQVVTFTQVGTGAVARPTQDKLRDLPITVQDFGIVADGSTETAKWQAAINAISAAGGGVLRAQSGKVYVTGKLTPKSNVVIDLSGSTLKLANGSNAPIFSDDGAGNGTGFGLLNGKLDCNQAANNNLNVLGGVWMTDWDYTTLDNIEIINCQRIGFNLFGMRHLRFTRCRMTSGTPGSVLFPYGANIEGSAARRGQSIHIDDFSVTDVQGYGIHIYKCDDVMITNCTFKNLNYVNGTAKSIALTMTEVSRYWYGNINCEDVVGDNIEINACTDGNMDNTTCLRPGGRAFLMGQNTSSQYNKRIRVRGFSATGSLGTVSWAPSACIDCSFERMDMDLGVNVDSSLTGSGNNTIRDSSFGATAANGLTSLGWFTLERVKFSDYTYRYLGKQRVSLSLTANLVNTTGVLNLPMTNILRGIFPLERTAAGTMRVMSRYNGSLNQGSFQKVDFLVNDFGTTANLGTVTTIANTVSRVLTIAGDAANKQITLTNATAVDLLVAVELDFTTYM